MTFIHHLAFSLILLFPALSLAQEGKTPETPPGVEAGSNPDADASPNGREASENSGNPTWGDSISSADLPGAFQDQNVAVVIVAPPQTESQRGELLAALAVAARQRGAASTFDATAQLGVDTTTEDSAVLKKAESLPSDFVLIARVFPEDPPLLVVSIYDDGGQSVGGFIRKRGDDAPAAEDAPEEQQRGITSETLEATQEAIEESQEDQSAPDDDPSGRWLIYGGVGEPIRVVDRVEEKEFAEREVYGLLGPKALTEYDEWNDDVSTFGVTFLAIGAVTGAVALYASVQYFNVPDDPTDPLYLECRDISSSAASNQCVDVLRAEERRPWSLAAGIGGAVSIVALSLAIVDLLAQRHGGPLSRARIDERLEERYPIDAPTEDNPSGVEEDVVEEAEEGPEASLGIGMERGGALLQLQLRF